MKKSLLIILVYLLLSTGCMDPTPDYDECVQIETARCDVRDKCVGKEAFDAEYPDFDGDTCIAYAEEHCRTRRIEGEYTPRQVDACVSAILNVPCADLLPKGVDETDTLWHCAFIDDRDAGPPPDTGDGDAGPEDTATN